MAAIRFLLLTGFRRMEGLGLKHPWLDEEEGAIRFPDTKTGPQTRVIGEAAIALLLEQPKTKSPFFFPADWGDGHFIGLVRVLDRVCKLAGLADVTPHTLRHTFASLAGNLDFSELTIAALLGHAARGVTQRYVHIDGRSRWPPTVLPRRWPIFSTAAPSCRIRDAAGSGNRRNRWKWPGRWPAEKDVRKVKSPRVNGMTPTATLPSKRDFPIIRA
ncbi:MAG TPA: site-specific integrase [Stellaceae bacterium]|nr:site-specific integrase [Stellaceae bacterium]